jgi:hypothetical protein
MVQKNRFLPSIVSRPGAIRYLFVLRFAKLSFYVCFPLIFTSLMALKLTQTDQERIFFCIFTRVDWLPLSEITNLYGKLYKWINIISRESTSNRWFCYYAQSG